jgi:methionine synthase II (cobalamin-independent)
MRISIANHSSYPGGNGDAELARVLREQAEAGLDLITDGQLGWADAITPPFADLAGMRLGPSTTRAGIPGQFRQPIVQARLRRHRPLCVAAYRRAAALSERPLKVVLAGPHTLAHAAEIATTAYRSAAHLADELSAIIAQEATALADAGAPALQIDEPLILSRPGDMRQLRALLEPIYDAAAGRMQVFVATYGADAAPLYAQLNSLPADVIAVDCANRSALADVIAQTGSGKPLALGVVDDSPAVEDVAALARQCERLLRHYVHDTLWLQPASGLARLDSDQARAKIAALRPLRDALASA